MSRNELLTKLLNDPQDNTAWMVNAREYNQAFRSIQESERLAEQDLVQELLSIEVICQRIKD